MKKKLYVGCLALAMLTSTHAFAHAFYKDLVYKDMPVSAFTWTGWYAGINLGWGWGSQQINNSSPDAAGQEAIAAGVIPRSLAGHPNGLVGGVQAGYNYQWCNLILAGLEADFQGTEIEDHQRVNTDVGGVFAPYSTEATQNVEALGTLRVRLGYIPISPLLLYVTGGGAYGRVKLNTSIIQPGCVGFCGRGSTVDDRGGWVAGAGVEYMIGCNVTAKAEYLYYDLGNINQTLSNGFTAQRQSVDFRGNIFRFGLNYKFM